MKPLLLAATGWPRGQRPRLREYRPREPWPPDRPATPPVAMIAPELPLGDTRVVAFRRRSAADELSEIELCDTLEELLAQSDHVVIAAPATPETYHLIDADSLASIKPGAHIVNIARGSLVDQDALIAALDDGRVACASLDTVDPEPLPEGHPLYAHPSVRRARTCRGARPTRSAPPSASSPRTYAATAPARNCTASSTSKPATDPTDSEPASLVVALRP